MWESVANTSVTQQNTWQIRSRSTINLYSSIKSLGQSSESERTSGDVDLTSSTRPSFLRADKAGFWIRLEAGLVQFVLWCPGCFCGCQVLLDLLAWVPNLTTWAPQSKRLRGPKDSSLISSPPDRGLQTLLTFLVEDNAACLTLEENPTIIFLD